MKLKKLVYLEPVARSASCKYELDSSELSVEDYASLRELVERTGLLDSHGQPEVAEGNRTVTLSIECDGETRIFNFAAENIAAPVNNLIKFIRSRQSNDALNVEGIFGQPAFYEPYSIG